MSIPDIAPYTAEEARMIAEDMRLTQMLDTFDLTDDERLELWDRKLSLEARYQTSRQRTWIAWQQNRRAA